MKTLIVILSFLSVSVWASVNPQVTAQPKRTLKNLYEKIEKASQISKVEDQNPVLKEYNLIVSSGTWWNGSASAEKMWENLAESRSRELNVIVIYDAPKQDVLKIKSKSAGTQMYEYFDQNREFFYWFSQKTLMAAVLIGPDGKILFDGVLDTPEKIEQIKGMIKKKDFYNQ